MSVQTSLEDISIYAVPRPAELLQLGADEKLMHLVREDKMIIFRVLDYPMIYVYNTYHIT
jgi:hypothetical protein